MDEADLVSGPGESKPVVSLRGADLEGAFMGGADLEAARIGSLLFILADSPSY